MAHCSRIDDDIYVQNEIKLNDDDDECLVVVLFLLSFHFTLNRFIISLSKGFYYSYTHFTSDPLAIHLQIPDLEEKVLLQE